MGTHGWGEAPVATAVVEAVAAEEGCDPDELTSLYEVVDPDALEAFFASGAEAERTTRRVVFEYAGYEITVSGAGNVDVAKAEAPVVG